jgi:hypothetical protein
MIKRWIETIRQLLRKWLEVPDTQRLEEEIMRLTLENAEIRIKQDEFLMALRARAGRPRVATDFESAQVQQLEEFREKMKEN